MARLLPDLCYNIPAATRIARASSEIASLKSKIAREEARAEDLRPDEARNLLTSWRGAVVRLEAVVAEARAEETAR